MPDDRKSLPEEVAGLTEAVRELRDREVAEEIGRLREEITALRAEKGTGHCCGHHWYWHYYTPPTWVSQPPRVTCGTGGQTISSGTNVCNNGNTLTVAEQTGVTKQMYQTSYFPNAAAGGYAGQVWTVPVDQPLTVNCYVDTAGAAPVAGSYIANYADC